MVPFRAPCMVRRAELMLLHGHWPEASRRGAAGDRLVRSRAGIVPRCRSRLLPAGRVVPACEGDFARADDYYRRASQAGRKPYPGLALLRLAQGELDAAESAVRRMLFEIVDRRARARVLGAVRRGSRLLRPDSDRLRACGLRRARSTSRASSRRRFLRRPPHTPREPFRSPRAMPRRRLQLLDGRDVVAGARRAVRSRTGPGVRSGSCLPTDRRRRRSADGIRGGTGNVRSAWCGV